MRHPHDIDLPLTLDRSAPRSLVLQVADGLRDAVESGLVRPGDPLPSTRTLATRLGVSRGTVVAAFDQLHGEGWLVADEGGTRVDPRVDPLALSAAGQTVRRRAAQEVLSPPPAVQPIDLSPGQPDVSLVVDAAWRSAWREAATRPGTRYDPAGSAPLRSALADHVRVARGTTVTDEEVVVTAGVREGLQLVLLAVAQDRGRSLTVAVEDPGYPAMRRVIRALGHRVVAVPVDEDGLRVDLVPDDVDLALVTPGHQYPLGGAMPVARRLELLAWAREREVLVVEDDYDGELRFTGEPVPALAALDRRHDRRVVVTLGSFAKVLAPGIGVGHAIVPKPLRDTVIRLRSDLGCPVPATVQDAMTHYLASGALRRHTGRMRRRYRARRDEAVAALADLPGVRVRPMDGGLHVVVELVDLDASAERDVVARAREAGVIVAGMTDYWAEAGARQDTAADLPRHGLVIGLGSPDLAEGTARLRTALPTPSP